jgi:cysteinyl-tRNA synthetase
MTLTLYNTLTRRKEPFQPIDPGNVRMYVCGPTVYDLAHIGNARPIIVFDVLFRLLRHLAAKGEWDSGKGETKVTYARNITDVDDKINARAVERYPDLDPIVAIRKLTEETTAQFHKDIAALGVLPPTVEPRATGHIGEMVALCEMLVARGHAYIAEDHVLFDVSSMPDYGRLANRSLNEMEAGARVDVAPYKRGSMDFVLWKPSKPGEPAWPSPKGIATPGRPGWHIECSAMAEKHLGQVFDIHGGGIDLVFPHHENEIAQSRCAHGTSVMANVWMHNGFLQVEGEKMSKSLGNFVTISEALSGWQGRELRLFMLSTHYRQPINLTRASLFEARSIWRDLVLATDDVAPSVDPPADLVSALCDDLNTHEAIMVLHQLKERALTGDLDAARQLSAGLEFLGLIPEREWIDDLPSFVPTTAEPRRFYAAVIGGANGDGVIAFLVGRIERSPVGDRLDEKIYAVAKRISPRVTIRDLRDGNINPVDVDCQIDARLAARKAKDWKESDRIRDELAAMGIQLKDVKDPATGEIKTEWEVKR